jgi:hypothetical protein
MEYKQQKFVMSKFEIKEIIDILKKEAKSNGLKFKNFVQTILISSFIIIKSSLNLYQIYLINLRVIKQI